jgi:hypothetical protein
MKPAKATLTLVVVLAGILASESVLAKGHSGRSGHGHRASHARSVIVGGAVFWPGQYYPTYAPPFTMPPAPWGYIEQGTDSYYCPDTQKHFPDAQDCPGVWQLVTPIPTPGS